MSGVYRLYFCGKMRYMSEGLVVLDRDLLNQKWSLLTLAGKVVYISLTLFDLVIFTVNNSCTQYDSVGQFYIIQENNVLDKICFRLIFLGG